MKKLLFAVLLLAATVSAYALPGVPTIGIEVEGRVGAYVTTGPDVATSLIGNGFLVGGSVRYGIFPMFKVGISIDNVNLTEEAIQYANLPDGVSVLADAGAEAFDVEYNLTPVCAEIMFTPPLVPFYAHAGIGIYTSSITVTENLTGGSNEIYSESQSKFGSFIGAGVKFGLPMIPISFRAGARYHMLKADDTVSGTINAVSIQFAVAVSF